MLKIPTRGVLVGAVLALTAAVLPAAAQFQSLKYPTGRVTYKITGSMFNGTQTVTWIESGKRTRTEATMQAGQGDQKMTMNTWSISDGTYVYTFSPMMGGKKLLRMKLPKGNGSGVTSNQPLIAMGSKAGKVVGKGDVLGKPCEIREVGPAKVWIWDGLNLKTETKQGPVGNMTVVATKIETGVKASPDKFKVPKGYEVQDFDPSQFRGGGPGMRPGPGAGPGAPR
jgi:hypothetical protein